MAFQTTPGIGGTSGTVLGFFRIRAKYSVRGRRAETLPVPIRLQMMTPREREIAFMCLQKERLESARADASHVIDNPRHATQLSA
jgi:hypothetical protein